MDSVMVAEALLSVQRRMRADVDEAMAEEGLSLARGKILGLLNTQGALPPAKIAEYAGQAPRTVITTLSSLITLGYVNKYDNPDDARSYLVDITPIGSAALAKGMDAKRTAIDRLFGSLSINQQRQLFALLTLLDVPIDEPQLTGAT